MIGIFDGLTGLETSFRDAFPKADVQRCVVHKMRNLLSKVRKLDQAEITKDFKAIYQAPDRKAAEEAFRNAKEIQ